MGLAAKAANLSQATLGWRSLNRTAEAANPQSAPAITFSRPTSSANRTMRSAMSPGCSTRFCGVTDDPGDEHLPLGQLHLLEDMVFVFVAWVGCFKRIGSGVDLQHDIDNILQGHFMDAWTDIDAVAGMKAHLFRWDVADRVIDGFDALGRPARQSATLRSGCII